MNVIPVLDLKGGQVVHAKQGNRQTYLPIDSALTNSSEAMSVVQAFQSLYPFKQLYIADIDAIQGTAHHSDLIKELQVQFPDLEIWLDAGFCSPEAIKKWCNTKVRLVLGSESLKSVEDYQQLMAACDIPAVLSLDFKSKIFLGPKALFNNPELWPEEVIVMTLDQVGSQAGPDFEQLRCIQNKSSQASIYAAGGVRTTADLIALQRQNITGALIASSLHNQSISASDLAAFK
jgi:phosphoribosylformimino-5-aminoimidazole carboxamide ribotide isomerase